MIGKSVSNGDAATRAPAATPPHSVSRMTRVSSGPGDSPAVAPSTAPAKNPVQ
jgi:hypothetical protein